MYRAYGDGIEFGVDYPTKEAAQEAVDAFKKWFPKTQYRIRKTNKVRLSYFALPDRSIELIS